MKDLIIFLAEGFEEIEALTVCDYLRRANLEVELVSISEEKEVKSSHGVRIIADKTIDEINFEEYRGVYIPGGLPGAVNLAAEKRVLELVEMYYMEEKIVSAICAGPVVLDKINLLKDKKFTCYPGYENNLSSKNRLDNAVVCDENIITGMGPAFAQSIAFKLIEALKNKDSVEKIKEDTLFVKLVDFIKRDEVK
ncbi:DJ-1 family glyoxalase III [Peptoniphilus sp. oral taxon 386]|uniref:DJ-1 family glyoxalase III n=1 Tax=Peptoniphilus sp. oral taxon 386 TaxID=652713 RepID=UPI0001DAA0E2|nr:DJ-1 family glyoxalase III [Peptoniphilus sp. oral taxon 386]EFI41673.1 DJ-1 family protein [Peptoniphilus sp. oral taxon 386 str. F0131]